MSLSVCLQCADAKMAVELMDLIRAYSPYVCEDAQAPALTVEYAANFDSVQCVIGWQGHVWQDSQSGLPTDDLLRTRYVKRFVKRQLYRVLHELTGQALPYGSLTGIRPTKLYYDLVAEGKDPVDTLLHYFDVSENKVKLIKAIVQAQQGIYRTQTDQFDHFANIPVCPTRCAYCSFIAEVYSRVRKQMDEYSRCLARDIQGFFDLNVPRRAIYVGGGTPTCIPTEQLRTILQAFRAQGEEFTVEAGRPETITPEIVAVLQEAGVNRVSVNPQSFKQETLQRIGRAHTVQDIYRAYDLVRDRFDVNMDLIAMLPAETMDDFAHSIRCALDLRPANITVHSLSIKRGSVLMLDGYGNAQNNELANQMSDYAFATLTAAGYVPYYMYRQKNTQGRLENVGYTLPGHACVYNVDIMEETHSIHASGAGAISKKVIANQNRIERLAQIKEVKGYIERIDASIDKKQAFFDTTV